MIRWIIADEMSARFDETEDEFKARIQAGIRTEQKMFNKKITDTVIVTLEGRLLVQVPVNKQGKKVAEPFAVSQAEAEKKFRRALDKVEREFGISSDFVPEVVEDKTSNINWWPAGNGDLKFTITDGEPIEVKGMSTVKATATGTGGKSVFFKGFQEKLEKKLEESILNSVFPLMPDGSSHISPAPSTDEPDELPKCMATDNIRNSAKANFQAKNIWNGGTRVWLDVVRDNSDGEDYYAVRCPFCENELVNSHWIMEEDNANNYGDFLDMLTVKEDDPNEQIACLRCSLKFDIDHEENRYIMRPL